MPKVITVFGATGLQGGSVIRAIQNDAQISEDFTIRGITRNPDSSIARSLSRQGVEVVTANQDDPSSLQAAVRGSHTVFLVTSFEDSFSSDTEVQQGKNAALACEAALVQHLIYSSLIDISEASHGRFTKVVHFDSKGRIERFIRGLGIPATFVLAGSYMQNFFSMLRKDEEGSYSLTLPAGDGMRFPLIDVASDYGKFVRIALKHRDKMLGKRIYAAQKEYAPSEIVQEFSKVTGCSARCVTVSPSEFMRMVPPPMAEDLAEMGQAFVWPGYYGGADFQESAALLEDDLRDWKTFVDLNKDTFA